jgi:hypothetical protein
MRTTLYILLGLISLNLAAQDYRAGVFAGPNLSFLSVKSDYSYFWSDKYNPGFGFELGGIGSWKFDDRLSFDHTLVFQQITHVDKNEVHISVEDGQHVYTVYKHSIRNGYLSLSPQISYYIIESLYLGTGLNINFLVFSNSYFKDSEKYLYKEADLVKNTYYGTLQMGIPLFLGFTQNNFMIRLRYDIGLTNKMKDKASFFKEKEHTLSVNVGFFF